MVHLGEAVPTRPTEIGRVRVTRQLVDAFVRRSALGMSPGRPAPDNDTAPLTFSLALRRGHGPEVAIHDTAFAIHGGHDLVCRAPVRCGRVYSVTGSVEEVFNKTGRSGPLTIVARRVWIRDDAGELASEVRDRQIVRWRPAHPARDLGRQTTRQQTTPPARHRELPSVAELEVGTEIGPVFRRGTSAREISAWASTLRDREVLFHDRRGSKRLGYRDVVLPGPMQSAFVDDTLRALLPAWTLHELSMTFRQSVIADEPIAIRGVITDTRDESLVCDITIENLATAETAASGTATLRR